VRVFVGDQEKRSSSVPTIVIGVGSCGLGKLAGSCGELFLWEQVRDLWVQEFLRKLIVGVATRVILRDWL